MKNDPMGVYWGVRQICRRLGCSHRTLFRWYRDLRFPMLQLPKGYAKFGTRATWMTTELLIRSWILALGDTQRKVKRMGNPWWAKLERGHELSVPAGLRTAEAAEKERDT